VFLSFSQNTFFYDDIQFYNLADYQHFPWTLVFFIFLKISVVETYILVYYSTNCGHLNPSNVQNLVNKMAILIKTTEMNPI